MPLCEISAAPVNGKTRLKHKKKRVLTIIIAGENQLQENA